MEFAKEILEFGLQFVADFGELILDVVFEYFRKPS